MKSYQLIGIKDLEVAEKVVFVRADLNVPMDNQGNITDDSRIQALLPTLEYLITQKARIVIGSHLGRPQGQRIADLSLLPIATHLTQLLYPKLKELYFAEDVVGDGPYRLIQNLRPQEALLLENLRFDEGEESNSATFCDALARGIDVYINEAFSASHRPHGSLVGLPARVPLKGAGLLFQQELEALSLLRSAQVVKPLVVVIGGKKISDKIGGLEQWLHKAQVILIGGALANTFLAAKGYQLGISYIQSDKLNVARQFLHKAKVMDIRFLLPVDAVVRCKDQIQTYKIDEIPAQGEILDIGPETITLFSQEIQQAGTAFWNGPMGLFEVSPFERGTLALATAMAQSKAFTVVGGGDSVAAVNVAGVKEKLGYISYSGGAALEFLQGMNLPGLEALR